jgi:NADH-quinone oxidoreductase subunit H
VDDGLKLVKKELILAKKSKALVFIVVPILFFNFSLSLWSVVPSEDFGCNVDFSFAILFQLFVSNLGLWSNIVAGVTSNSKYSVYGCLRIAAQVLS